MSETPGSAEYYTPPSEPAPTPPPPPSISDAAQQWTLSQAGDTAETPQPYPSQPYASPQPFAYSAPPSGTGKQGLAVTALVLGIVGLVTGWIPVWGVIVGVFAILFGVIALAKKQSKGMAISGLVMGVVSIVMSAIVLAFVIIGARAVGGDPDSWFTYDPITDGGGQTIGPDSVDGGLAVQDTAFGVMPWDAETTWFVVILDNPSEAPYRGVEITVNALDSSGAPVDTYWNYQTLPSGESAISGSFYNLNGATVGSVEVIGPTADMLASEPATGMLTTSALTATSDDYFTTVSGTVTSGFTEDVAGATVTVIARDASGTILGAAPGWTETIAPGASAQFDAMFYEVMPEGTTYEAYWTTY
jgi:hypothetical protein